MIYFDNAATTLQKPEVVAQAVKEYFLILEMQEEGQMMLLFLHPDSFFRRENRSQSCFT